MVEIIQKAPKECTMAILTGDHTRPIRAGMKIVGKNTAEPIIRKMVDEKIGSSIGDFKGKEQMLELITKRIINSVK